MLFRSPEEGPRRPASSHSYLHDDVKGQVEQQVADEDAQHVGSEVPGSVDESKEGAERTEELLCSQEAGLLALPTLPAPPPFLSGKGREWNWVLSSATNSQFNPSCLCNEVSVKTQKKREGLGTSGLGNTWRFGASSALLAMPQTFSPCAFLLFCCS